MTAQSNLTAALERVPPPMGGFSITVLRLEVRRLLRSRTTITLVIAMPVLFFLSFGRSSAYVHQHIGRGNMTASEMISIALFGAVFFVWGSYGLREGSGAKWAKSLFAISILYEVLVFAALAIDP